MSCQQRLADEELPAMARQPNTRVCSFMCFQCGLLSETLVTLFTLERLGVFVYEHVTLQRDSRGEWLVVAVDADK